jgi:hypothetical protein
MAERVSAYPFPEPESYPRPADVETEIDFGIALVPMSLYEQLPFRAGRTFRSAESAKQTAITRMKAVIVRVVEERPIHLVVGVALAAFIAGAGLRIWGSSHE